MVSLDKTKRPGGGSVSSGPPQEYHASDLVGAGAGSREAACPLSGLLRAVGPEAMMVRIRVTRAGRVTLPTRLARSAVLQRHVPGRPYSHPAKSITASAARVLALPSSPLPAASLVSLLVEHEQVLHPLPFRREAGATTVQPVHSTRRGRRGVPPEQPPGDAGDELTGATPGSPTRQITMRSISSTVTVSAGRS